jgi:hypothetical protein
MGHSLTDILGIAMRGGLMSRSRKGPAPCAFGDRQCAGGPFAVDSVCRNSTGKATHDEELSRLDPGTANHCKFTVQAHQDPHAEPVPAIVSQIVIAGSH